MLIFCPNCSTSYEIDQAALGTAGRTVRCARCKGTWFAGGANTGSSAPAFVDTAVAEAVSAEPPTAPDIVPTMAEATADPDAAEPPVEPAQPGDAAAVAEPIAVSDAPSLVPPIDHASPEAASEADSEDIESFAARRQRLVARRKEKRRTSRLTAAILVLAAFNVAVIGARHEVVRYLPQTASLFSAIGLPVNLRQLKFEDVKITKDGPDGRDMLTVQGKIVCTSGKPTEVPRLRFAARNATGQEIYVWTVTPSRSILGPGERVEFTSQLASPPTETNDVLVRFVTAQDSTTVTK